MKKYVFFKCFLLISFPIVPAIILSSCGAPDNSNLKPPGENDQFIIELLEKNKNIIVPKNEDIKNFPAILYDGKNSPIDIYETFEINKDSKFDILREEKLKFNYASSKNSNNSLVFDFEINGKKITNNNGNTIVSLIDGFKLETIYVSEIAKILSNLELLKNKEKTLREFLETDLPNESNSYNWNELLDLSLIPGIQLEFNDIKTGRYDYKNYQMEIGTFSSDIYDMSGLSNKKISLSIEKSFKNSSKPTYIFMVDGIVNCPDMISAEILFINRQKKSKDLNLGSSGLNKWNGRGIYGELDLSNFDNLIINGDSKDFFNNNYITSIKFSETITLSEGMFKNNKIKEINFLENLTIKGAFANVFDNYVSFEGLKNLTFDNYYNEETKELDLSPVKNIQELYKYLFLLTKANLHVRNIILPSQLLVENDQTLSEISALNIVTEKLEFKEDNYNKWIEISEKFDLSRWRIDNLVIPEFIIFIDISNSIKNITRVLNPKIKSLIKNDSLDLNNSEIKELMPKYEENLDAYLQTTNKNGIIKEITAKNNEERISLKYSKIFIESNETNKIKINIPKETNFFEELPNSNTIFFSIERKIPNNLENVLIPFEGGGFHLNLESSPGVFKKNFYKNLIYLSEKIVKITFPVDAGIVFENAFKSIDLSQLKEISNNQIKKIENKAFSKTNLNILNFPEVTIIGSYAFEYNNLSSICLPKVLSIGFSSFQFNNNLESIHFPEVTTISTSAFFNSYGEPGKLNSIIIPKVESIGSNAFYSNKLTSIYLPIVNDIGGSAFQYNKLEKVVLPEVKSIAMNAFAKNNLTSIKLPIDSKIELDSFDSEVDFEFTDFKYTNLMKNNNGKIIVDFRGFKKENFSDLLNELKQRLLNLNTPDIVVAEFYLEDLNFGNLKFWDNINKSNFLNLRIEKLIIPDGIFVIPPSFFKEIKIREVIGIENIEKIGESAFENCEIKNMNTLTNFKKNINSSQTLTLTNINQIGESAFENNDFTKVNFGNNAGIKKIPRSSFSHSQKNKSVIVNIPSSIDYVDRSAFSNWENIKRETPKILGDFKKNVKYENETITFSDIKLWEVSLNYKLIDIFNGLKVNKIIFEPGINLIPKQFLENLKVNTKEQSLIVNLSNVSIISDRAFDGIEKIKLSEEGLPNIIFNSSNLKPINK